MQHVFMRMRARTQSSVEDRAQGAAAEAALMAGQVAALQEALKVGGVRVHMVVHAYVHVCALGG